MIDLPQKQILAILFAGGEAVEIERIAQAMETDADAVVRCIPHLHDALAQSGMPFEVRRLGDKLQLCTQSVYMSVIRAALTLRRNLPLSQAALEVLAVIAYNQPVTRAFVEQVRGVDSSGVVNALLDKMLIEEAGRLDLPGHPISYKTTSNFLRCFGIEALDQLPPIPAAQAYDLPENEDEFGELEQDDR